jgi:hypothetical protein
LFLNNQGWYSANFLISINIPGISFCFIDYIANIEKST